MLKIIHSENLRWLRSQQKKYKLIYIDPPFNTGKTQKRGKLSYEDSFEDSAYYLTWLSKRLQLARKILSKNGSLFVHVDPRESHYIKIELDRIFGRDNFRNQIIWAYDYGGRSKTRWSSKHDVIFWYSRSDEYIFDAEASDRLAYMAPKLVGETKARRGKMPTDVWWNTIVPTNGKEKTGYPTQKPLAILERIVKVHSNENDLCLDFFAGSGSFGEACLKHNRRVVLLDKNPDAIKVMKKRLKLIRRR